MPVGKSLEEDQWDVHLATEADALEDLDHLALAVVLDTKHKRGVVRPEESADGRQLGEPLSGRPECLGDGLRVIVMDEGDQELAHPDLRRRLAPVWQTAWVSARVSRPEARDVAGAASVA